MCYSIVVSSVTVNVRTLLIININVFQNRFPPCATCLYAVYRLGSSLNNVILTMRLIGLGSGPQGCLRKRAKVHLKCCKLEFCQYTIIANNPCDKKALEV